MDGSGSGGTAYEIEKLGKWLIKMSGDTARPGLQILVQRFDSASGLQGKAPVSGV